MLAGDHALGVAGVLGRTGIGGEDRRLGLLGLEHQRLGAEAGLEQQHPCPEPDAAHADDLVGYVGEREVVEQHPAVGPEGGPVGRQQSPDGVEDLCGVHVRQLIDRDDQWGVAHDLRLPPLTVVSLATAWRLVRV